MNTIVNRDITPWKRPWNIEKFDDLYNRDERFFAILMKGTLNWLNSNIVMYDQPITHFIFNTGSSYFYIESNGYEYSLTETTGEDQMYNSLPRCIVTMGNISIPLEELSQPFARGTYERRDGNNIRGFNSEIRRLPIEWELSLQYYLSNFNESIILVQELLDKIVFQKYFNIVYLGRAIECSIEFAPDTNIEFEQPDMGEPKNGERKINLSVKISSNYPIINERAEIPTDEVISSFEGRIFIDKKKEDKKITTDKEKYVTS
jgi:hypothetical protein